MNVTLTWTANTETDLDHYLVYYGPTTAYGSTQATAGRETTMTINGLPDGVRTVFAVAAVNDSGDESTKSSSVFAVNRYMPLRK